MTRRLILAVLGVVTVAGLAAYQTRLAGARPVEVELGEVAHSSLFETALASGTLVYAREVQLRSEVSGRVAEVRVEEGQQVREGEVLMTLEVQPFEADLASAEAGVRAAQIEIESRRARLREVDIRLQRQRHLRERGLVGQASLDVIESEHEIALIAVRAAEQALRQQEAQRALSADRLSRTRFASPIDGVVVSVDIRPGETVIAGTVNIIGSSLMTIGDPSVLLAELRVDEADIARVKQGQPVEVFAASHPTQPLQGSVVHIGSSARALGAASGLAFRVRAMVEPSDLDLLPGISCRAEIRTHEAAPTLNVPVAAVRREGDGHFVWKLGGDGRAERIEVRPGLANDLHQAIEGSLQAGDRIVVGPGKAFSEITRGAPLASNEAPK